MMTRHQPPDNEDAGILVDGTFTPILPGRSLQINELGQFLAYQPLPPHDIACPPHSFWNGTSSIDLGVMRGAVLNDLGEVLLLGPGCLDPEGPGQRLQLLKDGVIRDVLIPTAANSGLEDSYVVGSPFLRNDRGQMVVDLTPSDGPTFFSHAAVLTPLSLSAPPTLHVPDRVTAEATSTQGTSVTYAASAAGSGGSPATITCTPPSGSTFPLGSSTVMCTATDTHGNSAQASFTVIVVDTTPPSLGLPRAIQLDATSPSGALVSYAATATDTVDASPTVACLPTSGTQFAIGTTPVTCTASDRAGNNTSATFTVTVVGAAGQLAAVVSLIQTFNVQQGISNSLDSKLSDALSALAAAASGDATGACSSVSAFVNEVKAQTGKKITTGQAQQLTSAAAQIMATIGCR